MMAPLMLSRILQIRSQDHGCSRIFLGGAAKAFTAKPDTDCKVLANGNAIFNIYYDRNIYKLNFDASGEGTVTSPDTFPAQDVKFGALVGTLPAPKMPGYSFGGWYDDDDRLITSSTIYNKTNDTNLTGHWIARDDTNWAIKIAVQDLVRDPETGVYSAANTYTEYKTVYKDNNGALLSYKLTGTTDTDYQFAISSISDLTFEGFNYVGYANAYDRNATGMTADDTNATVTIKPTDASTEVEGEYNDAFDGGIVWLYGCITIERLLTLSRTRLSRVATRTAAKSSMAVTSRVSFRRPRPSRVMISMVGRTRMATTSLPPPG